jgi:uncharacterized protein (DUF983 family)
MTDEGQLPGDDEGSDQRWPKPATETLIGRAIRLRCPRCGGDKMFRGLFAMNERCPVCNLKYERAPGYFLGSTYMSYALTAMVIVPAYVGLRFFWQFTNAQIRWPLAAFAVLFPILMFRHARALWLALDCRWDPALMTTDQDE